MFSNCLSFFSIELCVLLMRLLVWDYMYVWTYSRAWLDHHLYSVKVGLEYKIYLEVIIVKRGDI